jgi:hypothetical protein
MVQKFMAPDKVKSGLSRRWVRDFSRGGFVADFSLGKKRGAEKGGTAPSNKYHHKEDGGVKIIAR